MQARWPTLGGDYPSAWAPTPSVGSASRRQRSRQTGEPHRAEQSVAPAQSTKACMQPAERHSDAGLTWPLRFPQATRSSLGWPRSASAVSGSVPPAKSLPGTIGPGSVGRTGMALVPPTKSEPTGMASCRIGLVVRVCVGMQWNSKLWIEGNAVGAASPGAHTCQPGYTADSYRAPLGVDQPPLESNGRRGLQRFAVVGDCCGVMLRGMSRSAISPNGRVLRHPGDLEWLERRRLQAADLFAQGKTRAEVAGELG